MEITSGGVKLEQGGLSMPANMLLSMLPNSMMEAAQAMQKDNEAYERGEKTKTNTKSLYPTNKLQMLQEEEEDQGSYEDIDLSEPDVQDTKM